MQKIEHQFYNPGGVADTFSSVRDFLQKIMKTEIPKILNNSKGNPTSFENCYSFEYINSSSQLIYPHLYNDIISNKKLMIMK